MTFQTCGTHRDLQEGEGVPRKLGDQPLGHGDFRAERDGVVFQVAGHGGPAACVVSEQVPDQDAGKAVGKTRRRIGSGLHHVRLPCENKQMPLGGTRQESEEYGKDDGSRQVGMSPLMCSFH